MTDEHQTPPGETTNSKESLENKRERHKVLSATVRRTMFALLAYSASCGVIIAQPDVPFVLMSSGVKIPVINVAVNLYAFLVVGPIGLIVIVSYLHLFLTELNRITVLEDYDQQPFLFNLRGRLPRFLKFLIFYVTPILLMVGFSWKSAVTQWRAVMYFATMVVTIGMLLLYLKPKPKSRRPVIAFIGIVAGSGMILLSMLLSYSWDRILNLERAPLAGKKLRYIQLKNANLKFADLSGADLREANLTGARLEKASLGNADLRGAIMGKADLSKADLNQADLRGALISGAHLEWCDLNKANLAGADLSGAHLRGAKLYNAVLVRADLRKTVLIEAKNLAASQLCQAKTLYETSLDPELFRLVEKGCPELLKEPEPKVSNIE